MNILQKSPLFFVVAVVAACSSSVSPPYAPGTAQNSGGAYSVTQNGTTTPLVAPGAGIADGMRYWNGTAGAYNGFVYENADVIAIAVMNSITLETIAGISGTAAASLPTTGTAILYSGGFSVNHYFEPGVSVSFVRNLSGPLTTNVDFEAGTFSGQGTAIGKLDSPTLSISGAISGTTLSGTATFAGADGFSGSGTAPLSGGFYGTNILAGVYQNTDITGVIWGETP